MRKSLGLSSEAAIEAIWVITQNLSRQLVWLVFWVAHLALALVLLVVLWACQVTPESAVRALSSATSTTLYEAAGFLGLSVLGVLAGYLSVARWVWRKTYAQWHADQLLAGLQED